MISSLKNQALYRKTSVNTETIPNIAPLKGLTKGQRFVASSLVGLFNNNKSVSMSQARLGKLSGYSRATANRTIKLLERHGFIQITHRFNNSNFYRLHPSLLDASIRESVSDDIVAFKYVNRIEPEPVNESKCYTNNRNCFFNNVTLRISGKQTMLKSVPPSMPAFVSFRKNEKTFPRDVPTDNWPDKAIWNMLRTMDKPHKAGVIIQISSLSQRNETNLPPQGASMIVPSYIDDIHELDLKHADKVQLSVYPENVITYVRKEFAKQSGLQNKVGWFMSVCKKTNERFKQMGTLDNAAQKPKTPAYPYREWKQPEPLQRKQLTEQEKEQAMEEVKRIKDPLLRELLLRQYVEKPFEAPIASRKEESQQLAMGHAINTGLPEQRPLEPTLKELQIQLLQKAGQEVADKYDFGKIGVVYDRANAEREYKRLTAKGIDVTDYIEDIAPAILTPLAKKVTSTSILDEIDCSNDCEDYQNINTNILFMD